MRTWACDLHGTFRQDGLDAVAAKHRVGALEIAPTKYTIGISRRACPACGGHLRPASDGETSAMIVRAKITTNRAAEAA